MIFIIAKDLQEQLRALEGVLKNETASPYYFSQENFTNFFLEAETFPIFSQSKTIVVKQVDQLNKNELELLYAYVERPNSWIQLYLTAAPFSSQSKFIKKAKQVIHIKEEKLWEKEKRLVQWVIEEAAAAKVALSTLTAQTFVKSVDSQFLRNELDKLICFVGDKQEITVEDIHAISTSIHHETLWQLGEAIFALQSGKALQIGKILLEDGMAFFSLLAHLRTQFHTMQQVLHACEQGGKAAVLKAFPYLKGGLLDKKIQSAQRYGAGRLRRGLIFLFETELKGKNSAIDPLLLLEILLVKLTNDSLSSSQRLRAG